MVFNSMLTAPVTCRQEKRRTSGLRGTSHPVAARTNFLPDPDRLVVDLADATLAGEAIPSLARLGRE